jgi:hypothetical protein
MQFARGVDKLIRTVIDSAELSEISALFVVDFIPGKCPFERDIYVGSLKLFHVPAICHLNPYFSNLVQLRLRAIDVLLLKYEYSLINGKFSPPSQDVYNGDDFGITIGHDRDDYGSWSEQIDEDKDEWTNFAVGLSNDTQGML